MNNNIKTQYQEAKELFQSGKAPEGVVCRTVRRNKRSGNPTSIKEAAVPTSDLHFLDVRVARKPDGALGILARLSNVKAPNEKYPDTVLLGGQHVGQALTKWWDLEPTDVGRGASFSWDDELLPVFTRMVKELVTAEPENVPSLPSVLGTECPAQPYAESILAAAAAGKLTMLETPCSGEVTYITDPEHLVRSPQVHARGSIRIIQKLDENGLVAEENVASCDEIPIPRGTRPIVKEGQKVELHEQILEIDPEALATLTAVQLDDLVACCNTPAILLEQELPVAVADKADVEPSMYLGDMPLYKGVNGKLPGGKLHFGLASLINVDSTPLFLVEKAGSGIFEGPNLRVSLRPVDVKWALKSAFVPPTPRDMERAAARQRTRQLRELGERGSFEQLVSEAVAMGVKEYDLKLDHVSSGPFALPKAVHGALQLFLMQVRLGEHARLAPDEKAVIINEFLEELGNEAQFSTGEAGNVAV